MGIAWEEWISNGINMGFTFGYFHMASYGNQWISWSENDLQIVDCQYLYGYLYKILPWEMAHL